MLADPESPGKLFATGFATQIDGTGQNWVARLPALRLPLGPKTLAKRHWTIRGGMDQRAVARGDGASNPNFGTTR
jgi:hypothetical protein